MTNEAVDRNGYPHRQVPRRDVKLHHCGQARAKDANITQALVDRFAPGEPNKGKGTKAEPEFFYCLGCHETFSTVANFDRHRRGGECSHPRSVGLVLVRRAGYSVWQQPGNEWIGGSS